MNWVYALRLLNALLAGALVGFCFLRDGFDTRDRVRNARIFGLGTLAIVLAWGSFARIHDEFNLRVPLTTIGLVVSIYGMRRVAKGERQ